jgi:hypothetical protein
VQRGSSAQQWHMQRCGAAAAGCACCGHELCCAAGRWLPRLP